MAGSKVPAIAGSQEAQKSRRSESILSWCHYPLSLTSDLPIFACMKPTDNRYSRSDIRPGSKASYACRISRWTFVHTTFSKSASFNPR